MSKTHRSTKIEDAYLGEPELEPQPSPIDPDHALRVAAADRVKIQPDQRVLPQGQKRIDFDAAEAVAEVVNAEYEKKIKAEVKEMKASGEADEVPVPESGPSDGVA